MASNINKTVIILLASYNGSSYIEAQIDSIIAQTYTNWQLYIRDDNSTDDTPKIIQNYSLRDKRIHILKDGKGNLKSSQNFNTLMTHCRDFGDYFMFCDQDDIWMPNKINESFYAIKSIEKLHEPAICFGTYELIGKNGNKIEFSKINYDFGLNLKILIAMNYFYGCTMIINKSLLERCIEISPNAENHDYWIALIAALSDAQYKYISKPLMYYRQHNNNVSGSYTDANFKNRFGRFFKNTEIIAIFNKFEMFQDALLSSSSFVSAEKKVFVENYITAFKKGRFFAFFFVISKKIRKITVLSTLNYYFSIIR